MEKRGNLTLPRKPNKMIRMIKSVIWLVLELGQLQQATALLSTALMILACSGDGFPLLYLTLPMC